LAEIGKLSMVRALGLSEAVFADASDRIVAAWRARAARMYPSDFADCPEPVRYTLLAALCWTRQAEIVDGLVELLIGLIHRINARAERRVEKELIGDLVGVRLTVALGVLGRDGRGQAGGGQGAPGPRREPRQDRQRPWRQPRLDLPAPWPLRASKARPSRMRARF